MAKAKTAEDGKTQRQRFLDLAREVGASEDEGAFERSLKRVATAPVRKPKKAARKSK
jgi:hypothetical protein